MEMLRKRKSNLLLKMFGNKYQFYTFVALLKKLVVTKNIPGEVGEWLKPTVC